VSDMLASLAISKRKLVTFLTATAAAAAGLLSVPTTALAAPKKGKLKPKNKKDEAEQALKGSRDVGLMILVDFKGNIDAYPIGGGNVKVKDDPDPPKDREMLGYDDVTIEVYHVNPDCIRVKIGGSWVCISQ
jgi:hypothetical protein